MHTQIKRLKILLFIFHYLTIYRIKTRFPCRRGLPGRPEMNARFALLLFYHTRSAKTTLFSPSKANLLQKIVLLWEAVPPVR